MPGRNLEKIYLDDTFYHIYNRGLNKEPIFFDEQDYSVFLNLFKRYLSNESVKDKKGREYSWLHKDLELLAYCLMPNHFHLLIYQNSPEAMTRLLKGVSTTYGMYFNKRYKRVGGIFQNRFKASVISSDQYLQHISRYIHLNPKNHKQWAFSSLPYYLGQETASWIQPKRILDLFEDIDEYLKFLDDYRDYKISFNQIKHELANV